MVAVRSRDRGGFAPHPGTVQLLRDESAYGVHCPLVQSRIPDDAAGAYVFRLKFKLGLDEHQGVSSFFQQGKGGWQDFFQRDEGDVGNDQIHLFPNILRSHVAGVEFFLHNDAGVLTQFPDELVGSYVYSMHSGGSVLEQAVREASCGSPNVKADPAFRRNGEGFFVSYRDPHLRETLDVYQGIPKYLREFQADERTMTKYIIGAISVKDVPMTPHMKGQISTSAYFMGLTEEMMQRERDQILDATPEDIQALAEIVEAVLSQDWICVIGGEEMIGKEKELFADIKYLAEGKK